MHLANKHTHLQIQDESEKNFQGYKTYLFDLTKTNLLKKYNT